MTFNTYYITIPFFILCSLYFGRYKLKKAPMAFCSILSGATVTFSVAAESLRGLVQLFLDFNGFDTSPKIARFCALMAIFLTGILVAGVCYLLYTRNSKERVKRRRTSGRTDFGDLNEIAYGDSVTILELVPVYGRR